MSPPADVNIPPADATLNNPPLGTPPSPAPDPSKPSDLEIVEFPIKGQTDRDGALINAVFTTTKHFVIYEADGQIRYRLPENYEAGKRMRAKIAALGGLRASIENLRLDPALSDNDRNRAARETAWALALAFEDETAPPWSIPKDILTDVDTRLRRLIQSHHRKEYAFANLKAFLFIEVVLMLAAVILAYGYNPPGNLGVAHRYALYGVAGGFGAFLSVIINLQKVNIDIGLGGWEHAFAGATRIFIGVIGAFVVGLALDSAFIDPTFGNQGAMHASTPLTPRTVIDKILALKLFFAFIAGFSESLVPDLLRRGEQAAGPADTKGQTAVVPGSSTPVGK